MTYTYRHIYVDIDSSKLYIHGFSYYTEENLVSFEAAGNYDDTKSVLVSKSQFLIALKARDQERITIRQLYIFKVEPL